MKTFRTTLLTLIIVGTAAIATEKIWVPKLVGWIIARQDQANPALTAVPAVTTDTVITFPAGGQQLIRGHTYVLTWKGGSDDMMIFLIDVALKSVGASVSSVDRVYHVKNTGSYSYTVPTYVQPGTYQFEIGNVTSAEFQISAQ